MVMDTSSAMTTGEDAVKGLRTWGPYEQFVGQHQRTGICKCFASIFAIGRSCLWLPKEQDILGLIEFRDIMARDQGLVSLYDSGEM